VIGSTVNGVLAVAISRVTSSAKGRLAGRPATASWNAHRHPVRGHHANPHQHGQARSMIAGTVKGVISQRLVPTIDGGRVPALEIMINNTPVDSQLSKLWGSAHDQRHLDCAGAWRVPVPDS